MFARNEARLFYRCSDQEASSELETIQESQDRDEEPQHPAMDHSPLMSRRASAAPVSTPKGSPDSGSPRVKRSRFGVRKSSISTLLALAVRQGRDSHGRSQSLPFLQKPPVLDRRGCERYNLHALSVILSLLYGKMLVVLGLAFPIAQFISREVPTTYSEGFYLYLYFGYMVFLLCLYGPILKQKAVESVIHADKEHLDEPNLEARIPINTSQTGRRRRYGSFYLRMGAVVFGIGSMIYSVLEFGQYFDMKDSEKCHNALIALTPAVRVVFIIVQLQFIFYTNKQLAIKKFKALGRFGLMHMVATNVCVWLNVLVQETKYELLKYHRSDMEFKARGMNVHGGDATRSNTSLDYLESTPSNGSGAHQHRVARGLLIEDLYDCRSADIMGDLVHDASPFLFPCTIEYSLICAVILYTMWKDACSLRGGQGEGGAYGNQVANAKSSRTNMAQHMRVDCANAQKGLFSGILVLVLTIISLIMFFVLIEEPGYEYTAVLEVNVMMMILYVLNVLATFICAYRMKELRYDNNRYFQLDNTLLVVAQLGLYVMNVASLIACYFSSNGKFYFLVKSVASLVQATLQTVFIIDAWWRTCTTPSQMRRRPGRQLITFLLVTNLALWLVSRTQNARHEFHPLEVEFYGVWAWTVIAHVSMPLAIFYRFHSTVCLCEIWKCTYKMKLVPH